MTEPIAGRLIKKTGPWSNEDWEVFMRAAAAPYEAVNAITEEQGEQGRPGWVPAYGVVMNPATCPAELLPWLAQFPGVVLPSGTPEAEARALVKAESGIERCTRVGLEAALTRTLPEGASFILLERIRATGEPNPYYGVVAIIGVHGATWEEATGPWETGIGSWESEGPVSRAREAAAKQTPAGIILEWVVNEGTTWFNDTGPWETSTRTWAGSLLPGE